MSETDWLQEPAWVKSAIDPHKNRRAQHSLADNIWCQRGNKGLSQLGVYRKEQSLENCLPGMLHLESFFFPVFLSHFVFYFQVRKRCLQNNVHSTKYLFISYCVTSTRSVTKHNVFIRLPEEIHAEIAQPHKNLKEDK